MADKNFLQLNDVVAYKRALKLANLVWNIVNKWEWFSKKTVGSQYVEAIDSISANIAEGFGRYNKKDKAKFYYYSRGSVLESLDWTEKSKYRNLLTSEDYMYIVSELKELPKEINQLVKITFDKLSK